MRTITTTTITTATATATTFNTRGINNVESGKARRFGDKLHVELGEGGIRK